MIARLARLAAATLTGVAAVVAVQVGPAAAAACPKGTGVSVVIGGDVRCDADGGGKTAAANFTGVGHSLTYVTTEPGFVCQVDGAPSSDCRNTPPSSAYWALWWSDGTSGTWVYSNRGVGSLKVPSGGFVAFSFGNGKAAPGVKPVVAAPAPTTKPTPKPSSGSGSATSGSKPAPSASPSTAAQKAAAEKVEAKKKAEAKKKKTATATPSAATPTDDTVTGDDTTKTSADTSDSSGSGALGWVAGAIALALVAGMGGMVWRRRTTGGPSS